MQTISRLLISCLLLACLISNSEPAKADKKFVTKEESLSRPSNSPLGEGTITAPSGLKYKDVKVGTGATPKWGDVVRIEAIGFVMPGEKQFLGTKSAKMPLK